MDHPNTDAEAFWLTVCSSVASVITNLTLIYDLVRTEDFKHSGSGLTTKQRSLVIVVMTLLGYIGERARRVGGQGKSPDISFSSRSTRLQRHGSYFIIPECTILYREFGSYHVAV